MTARKPPELYTDADPDYRSERARRASLASRDSLRIVDRIDDPELLDEVAELATRRAGALRALRDYPPRTPEPPDEDEAARTALVLETKSQQNKTPVIDGLVMMTPPIDEDYWAYRVRLGDSGQAIVGFPKFRTIGIGFAREEDWNTNFPYTCSAEDIYAHIEHNKGDDAITREDCLTAIRMVQEAARADRDALPTKRT